MKTVLEVITATTDYFRNSGIESPRLNIEHLLAHVMGKRRMDLYLEFDRTLDEKELGPLRELVRRRAQREPLQHLLGTVEFLGLTLKCDARALIPRPETEQLCELLLIEAKAADCVWKDGSIVDVGTGSGCIALAVAAAFAREAETPVRKAAPTILGVDLSDDALALAAENAARTGMAERVCFAKSDLLSAVEGPLDLLIANLPYIPTDEVRSLQNEVQREPRPALDGGPDGMATIRRLIPEAAAKLRGGGRLALELGLGQAQTLVANLAAHHFRDPRIVKDYQGRDRYILATHG